MKYENRNYFTENIGRTFFIVVHDGGIHCGIYKSSYNISYLNSPHSFNLQPTLIECKDQCKMFKNIYGLLFQIHYVRDSRYTSNLFT
jgi:hypothetical protein